jgi:hypothetical protein
VDAQVSLAAIRWTARGNLVVMGGPTSTPTTLQIAAAHISNANQGFEFGDKGTACVCGKGSQVCR